ncbi:homeodomain-interacting protein kinase 1-like [Acanthochromis polyacanthus]|uniref:homeodomain-interacting protein kinase 1-like n=1 Tax=Acanthochromis polyacanthus TaxID=80966 RepID=UPI0022343310|nr:homeodomain-interacting protein kinase 1-like [Acanthochromis polyacanthus]
MDDEDRNLPPPFLTLFAYVTPGPPHGSTTRQRSEVPTGYTVVKELGDGSYGTVLECVKNSTEEHVAIKVPERNNLDHEAKILKKLMSHNSKESNIIEYKGDVFVENTRLLVFEKLDINLWDYVENLPQPMRLEHVRTVIQQLAVALNATKSAGIIHTDVKMENIMMVDRVKQPFRVKLIDFGLAKYRSKARAGKLCQGLAYRAPEIILGRPYSEAIDVWSLGCVMAKMMTQNSLFGSDSEYWTLRHMIHLLDLPPQYLIDAGRRSRLFFERMPNGWWRLKTPIDYFGTDLVHSNPTVYNDEPRPSTSLSIMVSPADPENRINLTGLPDEDNDLKSSEYEDNDLKSSDYEDSDLKSSDYEDSDLKSSDYEDSDLKSSEYEDSDDTDTAEDTEDSKESNDDEETEVNEMEQRKTKKKKNCFQRVFSLIKKTFCCCCVSDVMN